MGKSIRTRKLDLLFVMSVFCVFTASVLMVLMLAGITYKGVSERIESGYNDRTGLSYIWSKIKNGDGSGQIYISEFHGCPALCLEEESGSVTYRTLIYQYDGWIRELMSEEGLEFAPEDGLPVVESGFLDFTQTENGLICVTDHAGEMYLYPRVRGSKQLSPALDAP